MRDSGVSRALQESVSTNLKRLNSIEDPCLRYGLFLEIMRMLLESGMSFGKSALIEDLQDAQDSLEDLNAEKSDDVEPDKKKIRERERSIIQRKREIKEINQSLESIETMKEECRAYFDSFSLWIQTRPSDFSLDNSIVPAVGSTIASVATTPVAQTILAVPTGPIGPSGPTNSAIRPTVTATTATNHC